MDKQTLLDGSEITINFGPPENPDVHWTVKYIGNGPAVEVTSTYEIPRQFANLAEAALYLATELVEANAPFDPLCQR